MQDRLDKYEKLLQRSGILTSAVQYTSSHPSPNSQPDDKSTISTRFNDMASGALLLGSDSSKTRYVTIRICENLGEDLNPCLMTKAEMKLSVRTYQWTVKSI